MLAVAQLNPGHGRKYPRRDISPCLLGGGDMKRGSKKRGKCQRKRKRGKKREERGKGKEK